MAPRKQRQEYFEAELKEVTDFLVRNLVTLPTGRGAFQEFLKANPLSSRDPKGLSQKFQKILPQWIEDGGKFGHDEATLKAVVAKIFQK